MNRKFSDGAQEAYADLPVKVAYLRWKRGNAQLRAIAKSDPAAFLGGWSAAIKTRDGDELPKLPLPVVERTTDGGLPFTVYASNLIEFLPIQHRTRFELRQRVKDPATGRENTVIRAVSKARRDGFTPVRQVYGLVFPKFVTGKVDVVENAYPAVLMIDKWSSFISFEKAGQKWNKVQVNDGYALIRRYGTLGRDGMPVIDVYGESKSTPIEALGVEKPRYITLTPALEQMWEAALPWKECPRWNGEGEHDEVVDETNKQKFLARCQALGLSNVDIEQLLAENDGNYGKALQAVEEGNLAATVSDEELEAANALVAASDEMPF